MPSNQIELSTVASLKVNINKFMHVSLDLDQVYAAVLNVTSFIFKLLKETFIYGNSVRPLQSTDLTTFRIFNYIVKDLGFLLDFIISVEFHHCST